MQPQLWQLGNGWETLRRLNNGKLPTYSPYSLTIDLTVPPSADAFTPTPVLTGRTVVDDDAEFWVLSSMMAGQTAAASTNEFLGALEDCSGDLWYGALVRVQEEESGRVLSNVPVYPASIFGAKGTTTLPAGAQQQRVRNPYFYPAPWILSPGSTLRVDLQTRWAGQNFVPDATTRVWFTFLGFKRYLDEPTPPVDWLLEPRLLGILDEYRRAGYRPRVEPYFYGMNFGPTYFDQLETQLPRASMNAEQVTVSISDADFAGLYLTGQINDPNNLWQGGQDAGDGLDAVNPFTVASRDTIRLIVDQGASRLDDRALAFRSVIGNGRRPMRWPVPLHLRIGQSLTTLIQFGQTNGTDPDPFRAYVTIGGVRLWV